MLSQIRLVKDVAYTGSREIDYVGAGLSVVGMGGIVPGIPITELPFLFRADFGAAELETLAQTWSEHCVHKTLKSGVDVEVLAGAGRSNSGTSGRIGAAVRNVGRPTSSLAPRSGRSTTPRTPERTMASVSQAVSSADMPRQQIAMRRAEAW